MKRRPWTYLACPLLPLAIAYCLSPAAQPPAQTPARQHFDKKIASLLANRCLECHSGAKPRGGLDLTSKRATLEGGDNGAVVVPGNAAASPLWKHVQSAKMPPKKPLAAEEKLLLKQWIDDGAVWGSDPIDPFRFTTDHRAGYDWWALQPVVRPTPPKVKQAAWPRNGIDAFVLAKLEAQGLAPSPEADRPTLIRRLYFDLIGLPPAPEAVDAFVADQAADAYEKLVERLLASPRHGERWARHWLDVVRFGESHGFEHDELRPNAWPYRDWVIDALNQDMPFDQFARMQLAGDLLLPGDPKGAIATGFLVAGGFDSVGQQQQSQAMKAVVRQDELEDMVSTVGQAFLGLTVHCARCHDHKFDAVRQQEYYRLTAALGGVFHGERNVMTPAVLKEFADKQQASQAELAELRKQLEKLEEPVRRQILADRKKSPPPVLSGPEPFARWDFAKGLKDTVGSLHATLHGDAKLSPRGLLVGNPNHYASTVPLKKNLKARTLAARVQLANLTQRGGAILSLQTLDGNTFDAIVFGEKEPGHWLAGSNGFQRSKPFQATPETTADKEPVHLALVYAEDGTIIAYRNGLPHGKPYQATGPVLFEAGKTQLVFGVRHTPAQPGRMLDATIVHAEVYDRPLSPQEVAFVAGAKSDYVSEQDIVARLDGPGKARREKLTARIRQRQQEVAVPPKQMVYAVVPRAPVVAHVLLRGNPAQKGDVVTPGGVAALTGLAADFGLAADAPDADRRRKLAEWIVHPKNPLFARVLVNRLWHHHFGTGLVDTPNDFGFNGGRPSHPQLLDWLADEFVRQKFSLKAMHRLLVTSAAYRQSSRFDPQAAKLDANNRLLWRKSPLRLEAESVRDGILSVAGQLNLKVGGPGFQDFKVTIRGATHTYTPVDRPEAAYQRRTIYRTWARGGRNPLLDTLDCPDPSTATHKRTVTTTPLQALTLLNSAFGLRMAEQFAKRVQREAGDDVPKQIGLAYRLAYGRPATAQELAAVRSVVEAQGLLVLCRALFNSNEFLYVD